MSKETTRTVLLETGKRIFLERGYTNAGIKDILQEADVPKGSFYYYFGSKEDFGLQVLSRFAEDLRANFERCLRDTSLSPLGRLRRYFEEVCTRLGSQECRHGCLVGNLSQELADQSEAFRTRLEEIFQVWSERYAECLKMAQEAGEIPADLDVHELAEFCLSSWQGAILRAKAARSIQPIRTFLNILFGSLLQAPGNASLVVKGRKSGDWEGLGSHHDVDCSWAPRFKGGSTPQDDSFPRQQDTGHGCNAGTGRTILDRASTPARR